MSFFPSMLRTGLAAVAVCAAAFAQSPAGVSNFHCINEQLYRGAQPSAEGFQNLARLGVKTVIDLRGGTSRAMAEKKMVEAAGMRYVNLPFSGHAAPSAEQVAEVMALFNSGSAGPVFVHCRRGADRTGTVVACYRVLHDHWSNEKALTEAKADGMSWTEIAMHHFVLHYQPPVAIAANATN